MITRFGTSQEMLLQPVEENGFCFQLAIDSRGVYLTEEKYLNKDMADPNRSSNRRLMEERLQALGIDYKEIFEKNKHRIQQIPTEKAKKINPLKASKRGIKK